MSNIQIEKLNTIPEQVCENTKNIKKGNTEIGEKITNITEYVNQAWEKEFLDVVIQPNQFLDNVVTLENEIFSTDNIITISASPDNETDIINNALNIATAELRPLAQKEEGKISLKCTTIPSVNLYLRIQIEIQLDVKESE